MDLDGRRLIHAQHLVGIEVGLLDTAVLQRDLAIERGRDAEDDRALDLRLDGVGIDDGAAIDRADDAPDTNGAILRHLDLGNLRHVGRRRRTAARRRGRPFGQGLPPAGLFRGKLETALARGDLSSRARR